jgi:hypothetical protein
VQHHHPPHGDDDRADEQRPAHIAVGHQARDQEPAQAATSPAHEGQLSGQAELQHGCSAHQQKPTADAEPEALRPRRMGQPQERCVPQQHDRQKGARPEGIDERARQPVPDKPTPVRRRCGALAQR